METNGRERACLSGKIKTTISGNVKVKNKYI